MLIKYTNNLEINKNKVIVVGSSQNTRFHDDLNSESSYIIRFNRAPVIGYENIIGNKTDLRVVNCHVFDNSNIAKNNGYKNQEKDFVKNLRNTNILYVAPRIDPLQRKKENCHISNNLYIFNYRMIENLKKEVNYTLNSQMTVGAVMISLLITSGITPYITGFDLNKDLINNRTHYWEERPKKAGNSHNALYEINFFNNLIESKKVFKL